MTRQPEPGFALFALTFLLLFVGSAQPDGTCLASGQCSNKGECCCVVPGQSYIIDVGCRKPTDCIHGCLCHSHSECKENECCCSVVSGNVCLPKDQCSSVSTSCLCEKKADCPGTACCCGSYSLFATLKTDAVCQTKDPTEENKYQACDSRAPTIC